MVTSWAAATFVDHSQEISLAAQALPNGGAQFNWSRMRGNVPHHDSQHDSDLVVRVSLAVFACHALTPYLIKRMIIRPRHRANASLSGASEQRVASSGSSPSELQQDPFLTTLTTDLRMIF